MADTQMADYLLQTGDVAYMRYEASKALPDTVSILRRTLESDKQGGFSESWAIAYENIPARIAFISSAEKFAVGREDVDVRFTVTVAYNQSLEQSDRISHGEDTYEVVSVTSSRSWDISKRCQARKV
tara:strand:- start:53 stop:433 length:381 start_codon:yes stop_codon:yes gene_type:complete